MFIWTTYYHLVLDTVDWVYKPKPYFNVPGNSSSYGVCLDLSNSAA